MNRYPGPRSFTGDDRHLFFGRDTEIRDLFRLIVLNDLTVLFGESGTGKSSLLQAGVCPQLEERRYRPVFIRLNNTRETPERQVCQRLKEGGYIPADMPEDRTLWEYFSSFWYVEFGEMFTPVIVFDQFEELFTLYRPEERRQFVLQFAAIANGRPPAGLSDLDATPPRAKFVIAIRSDFLYLLDELSADIPAILRCRFQLRLLDRSRAAEAITRPAAIPGDYASPPFGFSDAALDGIVESLGALDAEEHLRAENTAREPEIAAFQLQLVCRHLETAIIGQRRPAGFTVTPKFYGGRAGIRKIIEAFYQDVLEKIAPAERDRVEILLARALIRNGRRIMMEESAIREECGVSQEALDLMHEERLLKREARRGEVYYEISHDTLVKPILDLFKRIEEEEKERRALVVAERLRLEAEARAAELAEAQRKRRRANLIAAVGFLLFALTTVAALWAWQQTALAREKSEEARIAKERAEKSEREALRQKDAADRLATFAQNETQKAVAALEKLRRYQVAKLLSDADALRGEKRFDDAIRAYDSALALAITPAEKSALAQKRAATLGQKIEADFERNRNVGMSLKAANQCRAAIPYLEAALRARPGEEAVEKALKACRGE